MTKLHKPKSWESVALETLATLTLGGDWGKEAEFESEDYALVLSIRGAEIRHWSENKGSTASLRKVKKSSLASRLLKGGDILVEISGGGPDQPVGRTVLIDKSVFAYAPNTPKISTNFLRLLRTCEEIDSSFLNHYLQYFYKSGEISAYQAGSNNLRNLKFNDYLGLQIPLPPFREQHRIVAKIEELFSELDKGIENLKTARAQLKVYRQALLKYAFEGKLTEKWREENKDKLGTAAALLKRIQLERAQRYQQQLADWEAAGKRGTKPKAPKTLPPKTAEDLAELPELPKGWGWFKVADLANVSGGLTKNPKRNIFPIKRPFLRVANVYANRLELDDMHVSGVSETEIERVILVKGDILVVEGNGSVDQIGRVAIWNGAIDECVHQNHLIKARPLNFVCSEFILHFLMSELGRKFIVRAASSTSGLHTLSISKVESLFAPLCARAEQDVLLNELSVKLSLVDQLEQTIITSLQQAEALRKSILKKAFSGRLVPHDPHDEPASALLARIKAEKSAQPQGKKARK
ncbi:type I restriction enzyme S subunit [Nitrosospira sp. Nsp2]|uniref:restriction endonuclease subunit S n=1 Tax=Nitrosospira sp. Nsp2 TaxID=136548 RepID=UPI000D303A9F|nr:restriction endonuclease subunit S [Nitrosospira sp. Nsp2]PTR14217.1 type I restriction enzyme S subunit [Nitrosospira sp. Nsp2]